MALNDPQDEISIRISLRAWQSLRGIGLFHQEQSQRQSLREIKKIAERMFEDIIDKSMVGAYNRTYVLYCFSLDFYRCYSSCPCRRLIQG
jgi:hypothetical protein